MPLPLPLPGGIHLRCFVLFFRKLRNRFHTESPKTNASQKERRDEDGWLEPSGLHLIPIPFADDIRAAPIEEGFRGKGLVFALLPSHHSHTGLLAAGDLVETAAALTAKLTIKNGGYEPDTYPNPGE